MANQVENRDDAVQIEFGLQHVGIAEFVITAAPPEVVAGQPVNVGIQVALGAQAEIGQVVIRLQVGLGGQQPEDCFVRLETHNHFHVKDLGRFLGSDKVVRLPPPFLASLVSISYSTARGILIGKSGGTVLDNIILPIISPQDLIRQVTATV